MSDLTTRARLMAAFTEDGPLIIELCDRVDHLEHDQERTLAALADSDDKGDAWSEGFNAGWAEAKDPGAFVNDVWDANTPNPYREAA